MQMHVAPAPAPSDVGGEHRVSTSGAGHTAGGQTVASGDDSAKSLGPAVDSSGPRAPGDDRPAVVQLDSDDALDAALVGAKAANLARARSASLPTLPGFVLTTDGAETADDVRALPDDLTSALRPSWQDLSGDGSQLLVVRSSSTVEDVGDSSMAGQFTSILDVESWDGFLDAVGDVLASAHDVTVTDEPQPMAVLVQPQLDALCGGVVFGLDPVTGDPDHFLAEAVPGGPDKLVSGTVSAQRYVLSRKGKITESDDEAEADGPLLNRRRASKLAALARDTNEAFGGPQDVEWAFDKDGTLRLLQSRPVTAATEPAPPGAPLLGPGPVGETFPDPLRPLEIDLWVDPLRDGIEAALTAVGVVSAKALAASPVVITVDGRVAADLELFGASPEKKPLWKWLDPREPTRHLIASWRLGRLRAALPLLAADVAHRVDHDLNEVPPLTDLSDRELCGLLTKARELLVSVHGYEVLAGTLLTTDDTRTAASLALALVAGGQEAGLDSAEIVARHPVTLALIPPAIGDENELPQVRATVGDSTDVAELEARESLRLRARWVQELMAQAALVLGERLQEAGRIDRTDRVAWLTLRELRRATGGSELPDDLRARALTPAAPQLPAAFRLTDTGTVAPIRHRGAHRAGGRGAGGGRGEGPVMHCDSACTPGPGDVLVVRTLDPSLAAYLPGLAGLVAETGSTLSHLAILAREYDVPTVVGVHDALHRYPVGMNVVVDGSTGELSRANPNPEET